MKKKSSRIAALVLTLCMVFFGLPVTAMAETASVDTEAALNAAIAAGSSVTLSSSVTTNNQIDVRAENIVLDLNGYTLTTPRINVHAAASLTIKDSSADDEKTSYSGTGKVTSNQPNTYLIVVWPDGTEKAGSLLIESGTIETTSTQNDVIFNGGTVNITGGKIKSQGNAGPIYATSKPSSFGKTSLSEPVVCNVSGDALLETGYYGISLFGKGPDAQENYDYNALQLNISGNARIDVRGEGGQGIATNSSGDAHAGFTINMTGGEISAANNGCGMYLPAIGRTYISGGRVYGQNQGIRIAAGELNVSGNAVIECEQSRTMNTDLINGGSGGTAGAIVAGKASTAYYGSVVVRVTGGTVQNTDDNGDAIVVSDKNMGDESFANNVLTVSVTGGEVSGNVYYISNKISETTTSDGGNTNFTVSGENTVITGDVDNESTSLLSISEAKIKGDVSNNGKGRISIYDSEVTGTVSKGADAGDVTVVDSNVGGLGGGLTATQNYTSIADYNQAVQNGDLDGKDVYLTIENGKFDENNLFNLFNVQKRENPPKLHLRIINSTFTGNTSGENAETGNPSFMYLPNCQELVLDSCTFDAGTDPGLKYGINWNLCGITGAQVSITNCTFKGTYKKNALKLNQRNGADDVAEDVKPEPGNPKAATITSALIEGCSFSGTNAVISLGSQGKGPGGAVSPSTGNFPITLRNNKTDVKVEFAYAVASGNDIPALTVNRGGSLEKMSHKTSALNAIISVGAVSATSSRDGNIAYWVKTNADGTLAYFTDEACTQEVSAEDVVIPAKKSSSPSDDTPSPGYRLPYISETTGGKNFVSDTTSNLTVNGKYQFRITSTDGHKPVMTVSNSNFTVELASQSGNDYFYVIRCAGAAGSTANVLVDGIHVVVATVGTAGVVSDTTHPFTVAQGATYQFKLTSASRPTFTGNNANFTIAYVSNSGNDWFFKVTAVGAAGASTTFSANGVVVTTATIA